MLDLWGERRTWRRLPRRRAKKVRHPLSNNQLRLPFENGLGDEKALGWRAFMKILSERSYEVADQVARRLDRECLPESPEALRRSLADASSARSHRNVAWGEQSCVDALRLRFVEHLDWKVREHRPALEEVVWTGALTWLGKRVLERDGAYQIPQRARRAMAVAVAASSGYRRSFEFVRAGYGKGPLRDARSFGWTSLVALRCVFEGWIVPDVVSHLIPPASNKRLRKDSLWLPLCLALRWAVEHRHEAGVVFLLSAMTTTAFRRRLATEAVKKGLETQFAPWGCGSLPRIDTVTLLRDLTAKQWRPWRKVEDETDIDLSGFVALLQEMLGADSFETVLLFFDEHLLQATLFALLGNTLSARINMASSIRSSLTRSVFYSIVEKNQANVLWDYLENVSLGSERARVYTALEKTPDPNVALGTPVWAVANHLSDVASVSARTGKSKAFRSVRSLLERKDLLKVAEPYWLLGRRDKERLLIAMKWIRRNEPYPKEEVWWEFLDSHAKQVLDGRTA